MLVVGKNLFLSLLLLCEGVRESTFVQRQQMSLTGNKLGEEGGCRQSRGTVSPLQAHHRALPSA